MNKQFVIASIFGACLIFGLYSCNLSNIDKFDGIYGCVRDATTDTPIPDARVYLYESNNNGGWGGSSPYYLIDSMSADGYGAFAFEFEETVAHSYSLFATKENYLVGNSLTYVQYGNEKDLLISPEGFLKIHFVNKLPSSGSDIFGINGGVTDVFYGDDVDTIITYLVYGNTDIVLHSAVGLGPTVSDTIYCPAFDTTFYYLYY